MYERRFCNAKFGTIQRKAPTNCHLNIKKCVKASSSHAFESIGGQAHFLGLQGGVRVDFVHFYNRAVLGFMAVFGAKVDSKLCHRVCMAVFGRCEISDRVWSGRVWSGRVSGPQDGAVLPWPCLF